MLKSRMSFVVRDNQQNSRFFYHQTFYEDQSDGFCMMSVGSKFYLLYSYLIIIPIVRSFSDHYFFAPHARERARRDGQKV
jgi:hypothetical protein